MLTTILVHQFTKDLKRLQSEINAYKNEENLWVVQGDIANTAGNLCMHLIGNLNHFIGYVVGKTNYVRNRSFEFEGKNVRRELLIEQIDETIEVVEKSLKSLTAQELEAEYPIHIFKDNDPMKVAHMLIHLSNHLNYHLGQINYHRRLIEN